MLYLLEKSYICRLLFTYLCLMKNLTDLILKAAIAFIAVSPVLISCQEEGKMDEGDDSVTVPVEDPTADSLATALSRQIRAMQEVLLNDAMVSSCTRLANGTWQVSLSGSVTFQTLPQTEDYTGVLSYVEEGDVKYWAVRDSEGGSIPLKTASGNGISMDNQIGVRFVDQMYCLEINGVEYKTDFNRDDMLQAFACTPHVDDSGAAYAVTFDFGADRQIVLAVDEYKDAEFCLPATGQTVSRLFVYYGQTSPVQVKLASGVDYTLRVTEGWTAVVRKDGEVTYVDLTAPAKGASDVSGGVLDIVIGDDIVMSSLVLSSEPFEAVFASVARAVVRPYEGVVKFAYGICDESAYAVENVVSVAENLFNKDKTDAVPVAGAAVSSENVSVQLAQLLGSELVAGSRYVLWAVPALEGADGTWDAVSDAVSRHSFTRITSEMNSGESYLLDAEISVDVDGVNAVWAGTCLKSAEWLADVLYLVNNSIEDSLTVSGGKFHYEGLASEFSSVAGNREDMNPDTEYVSWVVPALAGEYEYTEEDVFFTEVKTLGVTAGGSLQIELGTPVITPGTVSFPVSCEGASMVHYAYLSRITGSQYLDAENSEKYEQIKNAETFKYVKVKDGEDKVDALGTKLTPNTNYYIYAVSVDEDGKYGQVQCKAVKTQIMSYDNTITLSTEIMGITANKASIKVTSVGGDLSDYVYWFGNAMDPFWRDPSTCGHNRTTAQQYIALNPDDQNLRHGGLDEEGVITFSGLDLETDYVFIILEKGDEGKYSKAACFEFKTLAADLGEIVRADTDTWKSAREQVGLKWIESSFVQGSGMMHSNYAFEFSCPQNLTAYVMCAGDGMFEEMGFKKAEQQIIYVEEYSSRKYDDGYTPYVNGEPALEPNYYKDGVLKQGQLMNAYKFYVHGLPALGFVTYFATGSHGEGNCIYWEDGHCQRYEDARQSISRYLTLEPYIDRAKMFKLTGAEQEAWAEALLEAYRPYYEGAEPIVYVNDGSAISMCNPYAMGVNDKGDVVDRVIVVFKDLSGNYYEPMFFEVPNYFTK